MRVDMSRQITCPNCGKQLNVPEELLGKKVACPRCSNQFRFTENGDSELSSVVVVTPPDPNLYPPGAVPPAHSSSASPRPRFKQRLKDGKASRPPKGSEVQTARFIERDPNATNVTLGADGKLPELALASEEKHGNVAAESDSSSPWMMIGVLCVSVLLSVLILLMDEPPGFGIGADRETPHAHLEEIFTSLDDAADGPVGEMRYLLGHALRAYNRGDRDQEERCYRQLLDLLNREDAPRYGGFSGRDGELKELLGELLR